MHHPTYLVGGAVRDELLGRVPGDRDYVVLGCSEEAFLAAHPDAVPVGPSAQTTNPTPRGTVYYLSGAQYTLTSFATIHEDLASRDLTINAMARDEGGLLIQHPGARKDLEARLLRPVAAENFLADPNRVYRAARLAAQLPDFTPHESLMEAMVAVREEDLLGSVSAERVAAEFVKALSAPAPGTFLTLLAETDCLAPWLGELGHHAKRASRLAQALAGNPRRVLAALSRDLTPNEGEELAIRLPLPKQLAKVLTLGPRLLPDVILYPALPAEEKVDLLMALHTAGLVREFADVARAAASVSLMPGLELDLALILRVHLPPHLRDLGPRSGKALRELRAGALAPDPN